MDQENQIPQILMVDDDIAFTELVKTYLEDSGFQLTTLHDGQQAIDYVQDNSPDLIILDLMMPKVDGLTACKEMRQTYLGPILMLTALSDEIEEVVGLEVGADDYLGKPLKPRMLLARIRALLRRETQYHKSESQNSLGNLIIDELNRTAQIGLAQLTLTDAEFDLLIYLSKRAGTIVNRDELYRELLGLDFNGLDRTLDVRVSRLRKKLSAVDQNEISIKTVRSKGFLLASQS
ncbi:MAG: response regulator transcription factor [Halioglobus sp.]